MYRLQKKGRIRSGKPFFRNGTAYVSLHKVGQLGCGFFQQSEGVLLATGDALDEAVEGGMGFDDVGARLPAVELESFGYEEEERAIVDEAIGHEGVACGEGVVVDGEVDADGGVVVGGGVESHESDAADGEQRQEGEEEEDFFQLFNC